MKKYLQRLKFVKWWKWVILFVFTFVLIFWFVWINSDFCTSLIKDMGYTEIGGVEYTYHMLYAVSTFTMVRCCLYAMLLSLIYSMFKSILRDIKGGAKNE